jgi:hypothetical protein
LFSNSKKLVCIPGYYAALYPAPAPFRDATQNL